MADVANRPNRCGDTRPVHLLTFLLTVDAQTGGQVDCSALNGRTNHAFPTFNVSAFYFPPLGYLCLHSCRIVRWNRFILPRNMTAISSQKGLRKISLREEIIFHTY